ncbi:hypothetical protein D9756_004581 [Leucocoprinus leucothites]|uniref:Uncharacterized protein n=1 Tax=Leucocoprinus leucothites TaxID=201217 RepID=A0A8H5G8P2_9AGAR|nr:hypothetical protein D9756_004581 [Leucoagaricus leucothites]
MVPAVMHVVQEFFASLKWLLPLSVMISTAIIRTSPDRFHSTSDNPKTYAPAEASPRSSFQTQPSYPDEATKDELIIMPGGSEQLGFNDQKSTIRRPPTTTQPHPPRDLHPFPLMSLPVEIRLLILRHCAPIPSERQGPESMDTFLKLLRVSKTIQRETYAACLPHLPLALWSKKGVRSFRALLLNNPDLGCLIRHLWIGTGKLDDEELAWALDIMRAVTQLRSLACGEHFLAQAVNGRALARTCKRITLMCVEKNVEYQAWGIKQVRLCTGVYSTKERFPDAITLCFNARRVNVKDERVKMEYEEVDKWVKDVEAFILVERDSRRLSSRGLEVKFKVGRRTGRPEMFSVTLPARWTEWDIWSSDVVGAGVWDVCGFP